MSRRAFGSLLLCCLLAAAAGRADDQDDQTSSGKGFFGSVLKKAVGQAAGGVALPGELRNVRRKIPLSDRRLEGVRKTAAAFRKSAEDITEREEYYIGRAVAAQILTRYRPLDDEALNRYVQSVAQIVALASDRPEISKGYHVQVLESDEINAMSAPGGFIFVTTGLLGRLQDEDQLAAVLAHEVAHIARRHGLKTIKAARLTQAFQMLGTEAAGASGRRLSELTDLFGGSVDDIVKNLVVNGYGRDKEYEADRYAYAYAARADYDPGALGRFLSRIGRAQGGGWLKTHPPASARAARLAKLETRAAGGYVPTAERKRRFAAAFRGLN